MKSNANIMIDLYKMTFKPTSKQIKDRDAKLKEALEYLGDKYLLAKPLERIKND
jgi:hypothetical protein